MSVVSLSHWPLKLFVCSTFAVMQRARCVQYQSTRRGLCLLQLCRFFSGVPLMERCRVDYTSPENTIVGLHSSWMDTSVSRLYISINPPSARWYAGALEVSSSLLMVRATHWQLGDDLAWKVNVPLDQRSDRIKLLIAAAVIFMEVTVFCYTDVCFYLLWCLLLTAEY